MCSELKVIKELKETLHNEFEMTDLGEMSYYLGIKVIRNWAKKEIYLSQSQYIEQMLKRFHMTECNPISTPLDHQSYLTNVALDWESLNWTLFEWVEVLDNIQHVLLLQWSLSLVYDW